MRKNVPSDPADQRKKIGESTGRPIVVVYNPWGGENGPVTVAAFKAADSALCGSNGGFDSHTPPPHFPWIFDDLYQIVPLLYNSFTSVWHSQRRDLARPDGF